MPSLSRHNRYPGINAHLQTLLPKPIPVSAWPAFHANYINALSFELNRLLPDEYVARAEQALQIRTRDFQYGTDEINRPRPDVSIYQEGQPSGIPLSLEGGIATAPDWEMIWVDEVEDDFLASVVIQKSGHDLSGEAITRIELLSPSNKPFGGAYEAYYHNRQKALHSGTALLEIDFFHDSPTPLLYILDRQTYPEVGTFPYSFGLSIPKGGRIQAQFYGVGVLDPLPQALAIPLADGERLTFDFNALYHQVYEQGRWGMRIDYAAPLPPEVLASFRADDQAALEAWRNKIIQETESDK
jgi:hypothetical protein